MNNPTNNRIILDTTPNLSGIVDNLGSSYENIAQPVQELVDNSISDFRAHPHAANPHLIRITLKEDGGGAATLRVEDSGGGIADIENALRIAGDANRQTPLNEHGQGLDQVFAYISKKGSWSLATRTADNCRNNEYLVVRAPYNQLDGTMQAEVLPGWAGELSSTGTLTELSFPLQLLATLDPGCSDNPSFKRLAMLLAENLRFTYSQVIAKNEAMLELVTVPASGQPKRSVLKPMEPVWKAAPTEIKPTPIDLGGGPVTVSGQFGGTLPNADCLTHYQANLATSGVILSINGRVVTTMKFTEIWRRANHPSLNDFVLRLDIHSDDLAALPETTAEKNGLRVGDPRLSALLRYIRSVVPLPQQLRAKREHLLLDRLEALLQKNPNCMGTEREQPVSDTLAPRERADLIETDFIGGISIWEGKAGKSRAVEAYQLRMYIDLKVHDGVSVLKGVLIAAEHPDEVRQLVAFLNTQEQEDGNLYNIELKTWQDFGIDPASV